MKDLVDTLVDEENQPHQFVGDAEGLLRAMQGQGLLEFAVQQTENGYIIHQHVPFPQSWIFRSAEEVSDFIYSHLLSLPH